MLLRLYILYMVSELLFSVNSLESVINICVFVCSEKLRIFENLVPQDELVVTHHGDDNRSLQHEEIQLLVKIYAQKNPSERRYNVGFPEHVTLNTYRTENLLRACERNMD